MSNMNVFIILIVFILLLGLILAISKKQCKIKPPAAPKSAIEDFDPTIANLSSLD
jgi:energy-converting hydrogenase Eha subunit F